MLSGPSKLIKCMQGENTGSLVLQVALRPLATSSCKTLYQNMAACTACSAAEGHFFPGLFDQAKKNAMAELLSADL